MEAVDDATVDATLPHMPEMIRDMVQLQRACGARPGELVIMRPMDVDRSESPWTYVPMRHKNQHHKQRRVIYIGPVGQSILARYLLREQSEFCFNPAESESRRLAEKHENRKTSMSCGNKPGSNRKAKPKRKPGKNYTVDSYRRCIHRACRKAKVDQWSPHKLRHAAASVIRKEFGEEAARVALGHSRLDTTRLYGEVDERLAREVATKLG